MKFAELAKDKRVNDRDWRAGLYPHQRALADKIVEAVGYCSSWEWGMVPLKVKFRTSADINLTTLNKLAAITRTDAINFNFGYSGEPGYSSYTPDPGEAGYIEIMLAEVEVSIP